MRATQVFVGLVALIAVLVATSAAALGATPLPQRDTQRLPQGAPSADAPATRVAAGTIRPGASGRSVEALQQKLKSRGKRVAVDGAYGPATVKAVKALQRQLGMRPTGVATKAFLKRLGITSFPSATPTRATTGRSQFLVTFPFPPSVKYSYSNDFGDARHQGSHQGNDIIGPKNAPVVSATYGTVERANRAESGLGGIYLWIRDPKGNLYYYAHLNSIASGIDVGTEVWPGRQIGRNGNTGDARYGIEHIHFEIRPGGFGSIINPYKHLVAVDPKKR